MTKSFFMCKCDMFKSAFSKDHSGCGDIIPLSPQPPIFRAASTFHMSNSEIMVSGHNLLLFHGCSKSSGHQLFHLTETFSGFLTLLSTYSSVLSFLHFPPYLSVGNQNITPQNILLGQIGYSEQKGT